MRLSKERTTTLRVAGLSTLFFLMLAAAGIVSADAAMFRPREEQSVSHREELRQVLSVVEHRTADGKVLDKMRQKMSLLGERELHVAALLCERINRDEGSAGASIAFSIVTAMIVLR